MALLWFIAVTGWLLAFAAIVRSRRLASRVAQLTTMYWELKYDHGELKARVKSHSGEETDPVDTPRAVQAFVPLQDLKKKT